MNRMVGRIISIDRFGSLALVDVDIDQTNLRLTATVIGLDSVSDRLINDTKVNLLFAEMDVTLAKNIAGMISTRNRIHCSVTGIERGQLLTSISLIALTESNMPNLAHPLTAVITTRSSYSLELVIGDRVEALIKANEMRLEIFEE